MAAMKRKQERARQKAMGGVQDREKVVRDVQLPETIVVSELANRMAERVADVVKSLMNMGMMVTQNQTIDADTAELIIEEFGHRIIRVSDADVELLDLARDAIAVGEDHHVAVGQLEQVLEHAMAFPVDQRLSTRQGEDPRAEPVGLGELGGVEIAGGH